ncbi:potassium/proton antiporter [Neorhizobium petrolearium]|uniref:Potassium/proton antiporter n=1 Tax=Neorhizobium petrolearium TaxID=515361 RepID=A0ABY8LY75_9HYPH|nr:potassium/proton antiporter [Neorhizobium petrolearium]MCC2611428.1 potassium/proton antiporter [Neorhizobium petrolearium]WGI66621.1 potassium/proton antiporter [Neorhizobium petrolearium]
MEAFYIILLVGTVLVLSAALSSLLAFRFGAPLLLVFLSIGLLAGVDGLGIQFENYSFTFMLGSLALAIVLFDSGFMTPAHSFRIAAAPALTLASAGVLLTAGIFAIAASFFLGFSFVEGLLLGSIVASTDAAAVFFLLRIGGINIRDRVRSTLEVESGTNDPMAIFLTIALSELVATGQGFSGLDFRFLMLFIEQMGLGLIFGLFGGMMIVWVLNRFTSDRGLAPIFVLTLALLVFAFTGVMGGSGFLAVYVAGIYSGNRRMFAKQQIVRFNEGLTWLAQIIMFLVLGLLATPSQFPAILLPAIGLALFLMFVARPVAVWLSLLPYDFTQQETGFVAWVGLRGAVSILLAIMPILSGVESGSVFFNTTFIIVLASLLVQGWTIRPVAERLGLIIPPRMGAVDKVELDLPGKATHELISYRVMKDSPILSGERIPRWAMPSLVIRDGRSMRYQYAGRLKEGDQVYLFVAPSYTKLLDRLFASRVPVEEDDAEFFGAFAISPTRPARELDAAYGPGLLSANEQNMTVGDLMTSRLGGRAEYADRIRFGSIVLIVRELDEHDEIRSLGISLEPVEPATNLPIFINMREIAHRIRDLLRKYRGKPVPGKSGATPPEGPASAA